MADAAWYDFSTLMMETYTGPDGAAALEHPPGGHEAVVTGVQPPVAPRVQRPVASVSDDDPGEEARLVASMYGTVLPLDLEHVPLDELRRIAAAIVPQATAE